MADLYELSVGTSRRVVAATIGVMEKGAAYFEEQGIDANDMLDMRLAPDMAPFPFQVNVVCHHSLHAAKGILAGEMTTPSETPQLDYQGLIGFLENHLAQLDDIDAEKINACDGNAVYFRANGFELPFNTDNFVLSFTQPNLYFHATIIYNMLRIKGVPLGKMDFLGKMNTGFPEA